MYYNTFDPRTIIRSFFMTFIIIHNDDIDIIIKSKSCIIYIYCTLLMRENI